MKIIVALDSYKGCLSSKEVAHAVSDALTEIFPSAEIIPVCVADGGEGTVDAVVDSLGGRIETDTVSDPLGRPVRAEYGIAGDLAIIESAAACGLTLLSAQERNPLLTTTRGLGELILDAIGKGCNRFLVGLGGSATNDGGTGMISVPGLLEHAKGRIFTVACDVDTPFLGPEGTSRIFAPQKGATAEDVEVLEKRMTVVSEKILRDTGVDVSYMPGAGAAGGLGGAFHAYLGGELKTGVDLVLDAIHFDELINGADLIITGEGCSDHQTVKGKTALGVLRRAQAGGIPTALLSGAVKDEEVLRNAGFSLIERVSPESLPLEEAMRADVTRANIGLAVKRLFAVSPLPS